MAKFRIQRVIDQNKMDEIQSSFHYPGLIPILSNILPAESHLLESWVRYFLSQNIPYAVTEYKKIKTLWKVRRA